MNRFRFPTIILLAMSLIVFASCNRNPFKVDVSNIALPEVNIKDYGKALFELNRDSLATELSRIQKDYTLFLGTEPLNEEQIIQLSFYINDEFLNSLYSQYKSAFPSLKPIETDLQSAFQYLLFYYPESALPEVYTYISGVQDPVIFQDNILVIGIDNYLGAECEAYARMGTPRYIIRSMAKEFLIRDVVSAMALSKIQAPKADASVLEYMLYEGKILYFIKSMLPTIEDKYLMKYTDEQLLWYKNKEVDLWEHYIENELLFKSDYESLKKYINDAPFTSVLGTNSPPRTGVWLGYQILTAYAKNKDLSLTQVLENKNAQEILKQSKYKPGR